MECSTKLSSQQQNSEYWAENPPDIRVNCKIIKNYGAQSVAVTVAHVDIADVASVLSMANMIIGS